MTYFYVVQYRYFNIVPTVSDWELDMVVYPCHPSTWDVEDHLGVQSHHP